MAFHHAEERGLLSDTYRHQPRTEKNHVVVLVVRGCVVEKHVKCSPYRTTDAHDVQQAKV